MTSAHATVALDPAEARTPAWMFLKANETAEQQNLVERANIDVSGRLRTSDAAEIQMIF